MNIILGSGIVGLIAKALLPDWVIIPFARSRFYSFRPPLDDNYIIADQQIDGFVKDLTGSVSTHRLRQAFSLLGYLDNRYTDEIARRWATKVFGNYVPSQIMPYLAKRMELTVYDTKANGLYEQLQSRFADELKREAARGDVVEIGDHYIVRGGRREEFANAISTIPLDVLLGFCKNQHPLPSKPIYYLYIQTPALDFEGYSQVLVVDESFIFYKVTDFGQGRYLFHCHEDIAIPGPYFMGILGHNFDILDGTCVPAGLPLGELPVLTNLEKIGLFCVGKHARWDWCCDLGSCILQLVKYAQRSYAGPPKVVI